MTKKTTISTIELFKLFPDADTAREETRTSQEETLERGRRMMAVSKGVIYIIPNDYGVSFENVIIGFADNADFYGRIIHHIPIGGTWNDAGWFPDKPESFAKVQS